MPKYKYSKRSIDLLEQVDESLAALFYDAADLINITILPSTVRTIEEQIQYLKDKKTETLKSKHLSGRAVDAAPYPIDFRGERELREVVKKAIESGKLDTATFNEILHNIQRWLYFKGILIGLAHGKGMKVRGGEDWDGDTLMGDQSFDDWPHIELVD